MNSAIFLRSLTTLAIIAIATACDDTHHSSSEGFVNNTPNGVLIKGSNGTTINGGRVRIELFEGSPPNSSKKVAPTVEFTISGADSKGTNFSAFFQQPPTQFLQSEATAPVGNGSITDGIASVSWGSGRVPHFASSGTISLSWTEDKKITGELETNLDDLTTATIKGEYTVVCYSSTIPIPGGGYADDGGFGYAEDKNYESAFCAQFAPQKLTPLASQLVRNVRTLLELITNRVVQSLGLFSTRQPLVCVHANSPMEPSSTTNCVR